MAEVQPEASCFSFDGTIGAGDILSSLTAILIAVSVGYLFARNNSKAVKLRDFLVEESSCIIGLLDELEKLVELRNFSLSSAASILKRYSMSVLQLRNHIERSKQHSNALSFVRIDSDYRNFRGMILDADSDIDDTSQILDGVMHLSDRRAILALDELHRLRARYEECKFAIITSF